MAWPRIVGNQQAGSAEDERQLHDVDTTIERVDGEAHVISVCVQQLEPPNLVARARVFTYLYQRLGGAALEKHGHDAN